jgi:hypothetical protein
MLRSCAEWLYPETKFDLSFSDEGVCSACTAYKQRAEIDWAERSWEFAGIRANAELIMARHRAGVRRQRLDAAGAQVPLRMLAVMDGLSPIGCRNLDNISSGVDHIEAKTNPIVRRQIARYARHHLHRAPCPCASPSKLRAATMWMRAVGQRADFRRGT